MTSIAWHELTHASQLQRMKGEKNLVWASSHWSAIVCQEASNAISSPTGNPYGKKGDDNWQIIALAEGWANYRQWFLSKKHLSWNSISADTWSKRPYSPSDYTDSSLGFPLYYTKMFEALEGLGCSALNIERSLCAHSVTEFRNNLIARHPNLRNNITSIISPYE